MLHALLLHNDLPRPLLAKLLPLPAFQVQNALHRLATANAIVETPAGDLRISAAGYAPARDLLQAQGFLMDDF
jgi:hypothetical protein